MDLITHIHVESLCLNRGARILFNGLSFTVAAGEAVVLVGANGVGKTSLLRAIAGLIRPSAGEIRFVGGGAFIDADEARREHCHLIGHQDGLCGRRTARQELAFAVKWCGGDTETVVARARRLDLEKLLDLEVRRLSAGQRRRLALVRLVAVRRRIWLLDEPLAPVDARGREQIGVAMEEHLATGGLIVAAVHDPLPIAARAIEVGA